MGCVMMVTFTLYFHTSLPPPEVALVPPAVGLDDDVMEVSIRSHGTVEDGGDKISHCDQNLDIQKEGREDEVGDSFLQMMEAYVPHDGIYNQQLLINVCYVI